MEAIILAGGLGTRLGSRLQGIPKPMVRIGDKPFLEILLNRLYAGDCKKVVLSVGHLNQIIEDYFGDEYRGMAIDYAKEDQPLGTGGAVRRALTRAKEPNVLVLNGDTFLDANYAELLQLHCELESELSMAVVQQPDISRFGGLDLEGDRVVSFIEKGRTGSGWINGGIYALRSDVRWPHHLPEKFSFETDFVMPELAKLRPLAFKCSGYFLDIGVPEDLDRAQHELVS